MPKRESTCQRIWGGFRFRFRFKIPGQGEGQALPRPKLPFVWAASCGTSLERPTPTFSSLPDRRRGRPSSSWSRSSPICRGPRRGHRSMAGAGRRRQSPPEKLLPTGGLTQAILQARIERRENGDWQLQECHPRHYCSFLFGRPHRHYSTALNRASFEARRGFLNGDGLRLRKLKLRRNRFKGKVGSRNTEFIRKRHTALTGIQSCIALLSAYANV